MKKEEGKGEAFKNRQIAEYNSDAMDKTMINIAK